MANSRRFPAKTRRLTQFPSPEGTETPAETTATGVLDPPAEPETPFDPPTSEPEPPPKKTPKALTFFQRVATIARSDWGDRAKIKVYRLAPLINRLVGSEHKFITIYGEPVTEEKLKIDHGSGKYRLYLNYKPPGHKGEAELDSVELDILDPAFPPKIPPGEWMDDPRNKQWAWARPAGAGQQPQTPQSATDSTLNALGTFMEIQDRITERMQPAAAPAAPAPAAAPSAPTLLEQITITEKIMAMKADNPMLEIMKQQMADAAKATEAERQRAYEAAEKAREREFQLQKQLLEAKSGNGQGKDFFAQLLEFASDEKKIDPIKKLFGLFGAGSNGDGPPVRAGRTTGFDIVREVIASPFGANLGQSLGQGAGMLLASLAQRNAPAPANGQAPRPALVPPIQPQPVQTEETDEQRINRIGQTITQPMLYQYFLRDATGEEWAVAMCDMYPEDFHFIKSLGPDDIANRYLSFPPTKAIIGPKEPAFREFITEFCAYDPNEDEAPVGPPGGDDGIVDLTAGAN